MAAEEAQEVEEDSPLPSEQEASKRYRDEIREFGFGLFVNRVFWKLVTKRIEKPGHSSLHGYSHPIPQHDPHMHTLRSTATVHMKSLQHSVHCKVHTNALQTQPKKDHSTPL